MAQPATTTISGELRQWHPIALTFDGPATSEDAPTNPFTDYRLDVTFSLGGTSYTVPGFYAADGDAANTGATSGNKWRVYFTPDQTGTWSYEASFRTGQNVAVADDPDAGASAGAFDGETGTFTVIESDKTGRDFRGKGILRYVGQHHLQFAGTQDYFLKHGADSPENFLGYAEFDDTFDTNGGLTEFFPFIHEYAPHISDWQPGDPTWHGDRGKGIIGAVNYLSSQGVNSIYLITYNLDGGDGHDTWPWTAENVRDRYDVSKLAQWNIVFSHMMVRGVQIHLLTQETENDSDLGGNGDLNNIRKLYYRELIARFAHHPVLQWNLGEENNNSDAQRISYANYIRSLDAYDHPITVHTDYNAPVAFYDDLFGEPNFEVTSIQGDATNYNQWARDFRDDSSSAGRPWVIYGDEQGPPVDAQMNNVELIITEAMWGNLLGGGGGAEWYFGYQPDSNFGDIETEDFGVAQPLWNQGRYAIDFFQNYVPFWEMTPDTSLIPDDAFVLAKPGDTYAMLLKPEALAAAPQPNFGSGGETYTVYWYDPFAGGALQTGSVSQVSADGTPQALGQPPGGDTSQPWAMLLTTGDVSTGGGDQPPGDDGSTGGDDQPPGDDGSTNGDNQQPDGDGDTNGSSDGTQSGDDVALNPDVQLFDPALSKIGLLLPGETGVRGERLEWVVTVSNTGQAPGRDVLVTDQLADGLRVDSVDVPKGRVNVDGSSVQVTFDEVLPGETIAFSIFTTVVSGGQQVTNDVTLTAANFDGSLSASGSTISTLPETGEPKNR